MNQQLRVAAVQNAAGRDVEANLAQVRAIIRGLRGVELIALPEVFAIRGTEEDYRQSAEGLDGRVMSAVTDWAKDKRAWILAGSVLERHANRVYNTSCLVNPRGKLVAAYRKMHLFDAQLDDGTRIRERDSYHPGKRPVMATLDGPGGVWKAGLSVCYDVRFPELFRHYSQHGAHLLFVPSNFTQRTGKDHWEVLIRARAIENQCFVVAPNQCGVNESIGMASHGHSLIVGPWGEILAEAGTDDVGVIRATLESNRLHATRRRVPALKHRVM